MKNFFKALLIVVIIVAVIFGTVVARPLVYNPIEDVNDSLYRESFSILFVTKSPLFETRLSNSIDLITAENKFEEIFLSKDYETEYKEKFDSIIELKGIELTENDKLFLDCAWGVWYTEYTAKGYELDSTFGMKNSVLETISGFLFGGSAKQWRMYADNSYDMLVDAKSIKDLQLLNDYLEARDIPKFGE